MQDPDNSETNLAARTSLFARERTLEYFKAAYALLAHFGNFGALMQSPPLREEFPFVRFSNKNLRKRYQTRKERPAVLPQTSPSADRNILAFAHTGWEKQS